jgi:hypothetical protein
MRRLKSHHSLLDVLMRDDLGTELWGGIAGVIGIYRRAATPADYRSNRFSLLRHRIASHNPQVKKLPA